MESSKWLGHLVVKYIHTYNIYKYIWETFPILSKVRINEFLFGIKKKNKKTVCSVTKATRLYGGNKK